MMPHPLELAAFRLEMLHVGFGIVSGGLCRRSKNKGIGIEVAHYLGDGLFQADEL